MAETRHFLYGDVDDAEIPKLPPGFSIEKSADQWLFAVSPDGTKYFVEPAVLTKASIATEEDFERTKHNHGGLKPGTLFTDDDVQIVLEK